MFETSTTEPEVTTPLQSDMLPDNNEWEPAPPPPPDRPVLREIIETLLLTFFIFWLVNSLVGRYRIDGSSMNPTLFNEQYLLINNVSYFLESPERGDIIVFRHPRSDLNLIKRVIGMPGDEVEIRGGQVRVNGQLLNEPYIADSPNYNGVWLVPDDNFFVLGDNRNSSSDSHTWQFLPEDNITGKAVLIYWPPEDWGPVSHYELSGPAGDA